MTEANEDASKAVGWEVSKPWMCFFLPIIFMITSIRMTGTMITTLAICICVLRCANATSVESFDLIVFGGTASGVVAAVAVKCREHSSPGLIFINF